ncbi:MAG: hypothetical protein WDZ84_05860 [Rhodovibrionaceae bacterium]
MPLLEHSRLERSRGATLLSARPVVRLQGRLTDAAGLARAWPELTARIEAAIAAVGLQDLQLQAGESSAAERAREAFAQLPPRLAPEQACAEIGRLLAAAAAALMAAARAPQGAWGAVKASPPEFLAYWDDWMDGVGQAAGRAAQALLEAAYARPGEDLEETAKTALAEVRGKRVDGFIYTSVRAAESRGIPWRLLAPGSLLVAYGQGRRQRWIRATLSDVQSYASVYITLRKDLTSKLLARAGFPVPEHRLVKSRAEAAAAAEALDYPLVVKPLNGSRAEHVSLWLDSPEQVAEAYALCGPEGTPVLVECQALGEPYRVTVFGGRAVAAGRHSIPAVTGDGVSSIAALIAAWDARAKLPVADSYARYYQIDREFYRDQMTQRLEAQGLTLESVPEPGREVLLGYLPQRAGGGLYNDVTDRIHPGLMRMAEDIATVLGSPTLGVDIITPDVAKAPGEAPLAINEVNSSPSARAHEQTDQPRRVAAQALAAVFPGEARSVLGGDAGRIPLALFYDFPDPAVLDSLEALLQAAGWMPGVADPHTARIAGYALHPADGKRSHPGAAVLRDRRADAGIFGVVLNDLSRRGLPSDHADVAAFAPGTLERRDQLLRPAASLLAGLPGSVLLTAPGEAPDWLRAAARHRRWIAVAAPEAGETAPPGEGELLRCEAGAEGQRRAVLCGAGSRDLLCDRLEEENPAAQLWALAALLGLGFSPGEIRRLALRAWEARHGVPA